MSELLKVVLLNALPASGKSELRKYLDSLTADTCKSKFHLGQTVQLDDYPYVHMMRRCDEELAKICGERLFFKGAADQFKNSYDWGTLTHILNEDFDDLVNLKKEIEIPDEKYGEWLLERFERSRRRVHRAPVIPEAISAEDRKKLAEAINEDSKKLLEEKLKGIPDTLEDKTIVIEFARGGPDKSKYPIKEPMGYQYTYTNLSEAILSEAVILYLKVTPEISRQKNRARADPNDPGSIIFHGVPDVVMYGDYGCDDIDYLLKKSDTDGAIVVRKGKRKLFRVPLGIFDNIEDKTTFAREDKSKWSAADIKLIDDELVKCFDTILGAYGKTKRKRSSGDAKGEKKVKYNRKG